MFLTELIERHKEYSKFYEITNNLYADLVHNGSESYSDLTQRLSRAYFIMNELRDRISKKKIEKMESSLLTIECKMEDAYFRGDFD